MSNNFRFWVPLDKIQKSTNGAGKKVMKVGGLASTKRVDMDGESLDPNGFDISYLKNKGIINWNHNKSPEAIIGEPVTAKITKDGLYVVAELYDNDLAKSVFNLAETLEKNSKTRRLGFSIEGKATERDENDKTKVTKALVTNVALTISPKNPDSIVDIIKGQFNELEDDELQPYDLYDSNTDVKFLNNLTKAMCAGDGGGTDYIDVPNSGASTKTESVAGSKKNKKTNDEDEEEDDKTLSKAEVINKLMDSSSVISFEKANQIFETLNSISTMAKTKSTITDDLLNKALSTLGISKAVDENEGGENEENSEDADGEDTIKKGIVASKKVVKKTPPTAASEEDDEDEEEEGEDEEDMQKGMENTITAKGIKSDPAISKLQKSIDYNASESLEAFRGVGILMKAMYDEVKILREENAEMKADIEKALGQPAGTRKSVVKPLAKSFEKGMGNEEGEENDNLEKGYSVLSVSKNKGQILTLLDVMTFEKGFDKDLAKAMTTFESSGSISKEVAELVKSQKKIILAD